MPVAVETAPGLHVPSDAQNWAKTCKNRYIGHNWEWVADCWLPKTNWPAVDWFNEQCMNCHLIVCRLIGPRDEAISMYKRSSYPPGYFYENDVERPSRRQEIMWKKEYDEQRRERRRHLQVVK